MRNNKKIVFHNDEELFTKHWGKTDMFCNWEYSPISTINLEEKKPWTH